MLQIRSPLQHNGLRIFLIGHSLELLTKSPVALKQKNGWLMMGMQLKQHRVTMEDLMPQEHFLWKLESALDLSFVYEETRKLYSHRNGRPSTRWCC